MPALFSAMVLAGAVFVAAESGVAQNAQPGPPPNANAPAALMAPPATLPDGCSLELVGQLDRAAGTPVYRTLHREIASLRLAHEASQRLQAALASGGGTAGNAEARRQIVQVMTGMDKARDAYLCAAFVAGKNGGDPAVDAVMHDSVVPVFNRMAAEVARLENSVVTATTGGGAESPATILEERRQTGADLLDAVAKSEAAAVDGDTLRVTCAERSRLVGELAAWSRGGADEFTAAAGLMQDFLKKVEQCGGS